jgi:glycosyltransferase involved in cell wall biosynthesis
VGSREEYAGWLRRADVAVSTAIHEFFGIAVIEAVRAGCRPLLPAKLSYPELFPEEFLYQNDNEFAGALKNALSAKDRLAPERARELTERFSWDALIPRYRIWLEDVA